MLHLVLTATSLKRVGKLLAKVTIIDFDTDSFYILFTNPYKAIELLIEPVDIYRRPMTTMQEVSAWRKDEPLKEREPWSVVPRFTHVNSEMTK